MLTEAGTKKREAQEAELEARVIAFKAEQREMLQELENVGVVVDMVNRLPVMSTEGYVQALPILAHHLHRPYSEGTLESLARSLATPAAADYWDDLVSLYRDQRNRVRTGPGNFVMGLAAAVAASCPSARIPDLVELLRDRRLPFRAMLLRPLRKRRGKSEEIAGVVEELSHDPDLATEIKSWKRLPLQGQQVPH
jgi:hypothetical protein